MNTWKVCAPRGPFYPYKKFSGNDPFKAKKRKNKRLPFWDKGEERKKRQTFAMGQFIFSVKDTTCLST